MVYLIIINFNNKQIYNGYQADLVLEIFMKAYADFLFPPILAYHI